MPKMVVCEVFEVTAASPDAAIEKAKASAGSKRTKSMYVAAPSLDQLAHPVHLAEAHDKFIVSVNEEVDK